MKVFLVVCLLCAVVCRIICGPVLIDVTPVLSTNAARLVTANTLSLRMPHCYFDNVTDALCPSKEDCQVWLVSSLTSATSNYDSNKSTNFLSEYPTAYTSTGNNYSTTLVTTMDNLPCLASTVHSFVVGVDGACVESFCNGVLPKGENLSFKYILSSKATVLAETNWLNNVAFKSRRSPDDLGNSYVGRSASMVVITSVLSTAMGLLLLLLLVVLIWICCSRERTAKSYETSQQKEEKPSRGASLRILSYDVHHMKNASPYDNPAYEQHLKNRYAANSTAPKKNTTVNNSLDNITLQEM